MAVRIRLNRVGTKKKPFYRIIVADQRVARGGRHLAEIGTYNPMSEELELNVDGDAAKDWISKGAQPSETVKALLIKAGVLEKKPYVPKTSTQKKEALGKGNEEAGTTAPESENKAEENTNQEENSES